MQQNQHYVPKLLLKNFSEQRGDDFYVYVYDKHKENDNVFNSNIEGIAAEKGFYNLGTLSIEPLLSDLEGTAKSILDTLLKTKDLKSIDAERRYILAVFMSLQFVRTKEHRLRFEHLVQLQVEKLERMGFSEKGIRDSVLSPDEKDYTQKFGIISVRDTIHFVPYFLNKAWVLYETSMDYPLYISDNPITLDNEREFSPYGNIGLAVPGIEIYFPLSTTLCLCLVCPTLAVEYEKVYQSILDLDANCGREAVDERLRSLKHNPDQIRDFIEGFKSGRPITLCPENVKRCNSLQVIYSSRFVFCKKSDFELVDRMLNDNPSFRHGKKPTIR